LIQSDFLRIGVVPYANGLPLEHFLPNYLPQARIIRAVPSALGKMLAAGELDVAMLSTIELARHPEYGFIPGLGIGSDGPVASVMLFCSQECRNVSTVALDQSSLTSVAMARILFAEYWKRNPRYMPFTPPLDNGLRDADAALMIGDPALEFNGSVLRKLDMGECWRDYCGLPFVYAAWITGPGLDPESLQEPFHRALAEGLKALDALSRIRAGQSSKPPEFFFDYYTRCVRYQLGDRELEGLRFFLDRAREHGIV